MLGGKAVSPLALFPQYRAVQQLAGADRVHPADLWVMDWRWRELPADASARARAFDADARGEVEQQMLTLMRGPSRDAAQRMSTLFAELGAGARDAQTATLWGLAAAFFEAQAADLLAPDVYGKRVASRLLAQLRAVERGDVQPSDRLAQDLLFFCAQCRAPRDAAQAPRLWAVRAAYGLQHSAPVDYEATRLGRFDPALIAQDWMVVRHTMWNYVGLLRSEKRLDRAGRILSELRVEIEDFYRRGTMSDELLGLRNGVQTALAIHRAASDNRVSRGCHYREEKQVIGGR